MELVYLWVEKYKNIRKQGFNFSPRFKCEYNHETNELTIDENKEYVSIFPENINVTAIVGENGSGKSSILELFLLINGNSLLDLKSCILIYKKENTFFVYKHNIEIISNNKTKYKLIDYSMNSVFYDCQLAYINYKNISNKKNALLLKNIVNKQSLFNTNSNEYFISKHIHVYNNYRNILSVLNNKYLFDTFQIKLNFKNSNILRDTTDVAFNQLYSSIIQKFYPNGKNKLQNIYNKKLLSKFEQQLAYNSFVSYTQFYIEYNEQLNIDEINDFFENFLTRLANNLNLNNALQIIFDELTEFNKLLQKYKFQLEEFSLSFEKILNSLFFLKDNKNRFVLQDNYYVYTVNLNDDVEINNIILNTQYLSAFISLDEYIFHFIDYDFINSKTFVTYYELSDGEREILNTSIDLIHHLSSNKNNDLVIIADEIDVFLHPNWNKEILSICIKIFNKFIEINSNKKINFLTTTHSPFILSDLPKENVIFLKNGKQVYPGIETFGANIHTLLSHGFFMKDGLMGEFAKEKIDQAITHLNRKALSDDEIKYCENIISIIGEPILKRQLQKMLDSKRLTEMAHIKQEIKRLEDRMTLIWKNTQ